MKPSKEFNIQGLCSCNEVSANIVRLLMLFLIEGMHGPKL